MSEKKEPDLPGWPRFPKEETIPVISQISSNKTVWDDGWINKGVLVLAGTFIFSKKSDTVDRWTLIASVVANQNPYYGLKHVYLSVRLCPDG